MVLLLLGGLGGSTVRAGRWAQWPILPGPDDQENPDIDGTMVVWQDNRRGPWNIYAAVLDGPEVAGCPAPPAGDLNGDCRVDVADLAILAEAWLQSHLDGNRKRGATWQLAG